MEPHDSPCGPLIEVKQDVKDEFKEVRSDISSMKGDIACFRGKFDVFYKYWMPKSFHNMGNPAPGFDDTTILKEKSYQAIIKALLTCIGVLLVVLGTVSAVNFLGA